MGQFTCKYVSDGTTGLFFNFGSLLGGETEKLNFMHNIDGSAPFKALFAFGYVDVTPTAASSWLT